MKLIRVIYFSFFCTIMSLQGCSLLCRTDCRSVEYIKQPCSSTAPCGVNFNSCPVIRVPGYYKPNFGCFGNLQRLTTLRQRGVGIIALGDRLRFILPADNFFTRDSIQFCAPAEISECQVANLADIAEVIKCLPGVPIMITGHTDDVGPRPERFRRSHSMAEAVAAHLWAQGVPWENFRIIGRADCDPISSDASVFGSSDNRRVEIRMDFSQNYLYNCRFNNNYCPDCIGPRKR